MIIDNNYLVQRIETLIKEKQQSSRIEQKESNRLYQIKLRFPQWLRGIIFHPFNPVYSIYLQRKASIRKSKENYIPLESLHPLAVEFARYCFSQKVNFDSNIYYPHEDEAEIISFIDNRLKSVIAGYSCLNMTERQKDIIEKRKLIQAKTKKLSDGYSLDLDGLSYFLPSDSFQEHTYIHDYGLKYLPGYVHEYIKGKDFLDVGAYLGDTSILLLKKYNPERIFAYEPVGKNAEQLKETVRKNNADKIIVVNKGLGDKEEKVDIYINPEQLSSCTTNDSIAGASAIKEIIHITTIDKECRDRNVGLIKMDIEGAEYSSIQGALETIKRDKPVLLISLYHTGKDFFEIPPVLKAAVPDYQFRFFNIEIVNPISEKILVAYPAGHA